LDKPRCTKEHDFRIEYDTKLKKELAENHLQLFVKKLRNYTQHYRLPILCFEIKFREGFVFEIKLNLEELKKGMTGEMEELI